MMKKILILLILMCLLAGCGVESPVDTRIQVSLMNIDGCVAHENALWVTPGSDAVFTLEMAEGMALATADYTGGYVTQVKDGKVELTLQNVQRPVRVNLTLTSDYATITYDPNGAEGETVVKTYDKTYHKRPNTENGQALFARPGYTLVCWNTEPDGSGTRVGLGSRVTAEEPVTLYAQWLPWTDASQFTYRKTQYNTLTIVDYTGEDEILVIPERIDGYRVSIINGLAFEDCSAKQVILPSTLDRIAPDAFKNAALESAVIFDNLQQISDDTFSGCENLRTLYINAAEAPFGYDYRKESMYADKVDLLILAQGQRKMVFYGGCSTWYNLDGAMTDAMFGDTYTLINLALNGTVNAEIQMQILSPYLEAGDILVHPLELTSTKQLLIDLSMGSRDENIWCGLENNYDLFALVDLRTVTGELDSFLRYLEQKKSETDYRDVYRDQHDRLYLDEFGCIPFRRSQTQDILTDKVLLDESYVNQEAMERLDAHYTAWRDRGVSVYLTYACVNMDAVPEEQRQNVERMDSLLREAAERMNGATLISYLGDYLYENADCYDTNYHLLTAPMLENTALWLRDLTAAMEAAGEWGDAQ